MELDRSLGTSARSSLKWAGGILLLRGALQFATMLVLVRLLTPTDYGSAALAQSIVSVFSVLSFGTFVAHALQARNPDDVDWQAHFTAAVVGNSALTLVALGLAWALSFTSHYAAAALPLAVLSVAFIVEVPATLRLRMLQVAHDWRRYRLLALYGTFLSCLTSIAIALLGGGVWALVVQPILFGLPAAFDLVHVAKWRHPLAWNWDRYRATASFGASRVIAGLTRNGRELIEQLVLAATYQFAALGIFTRSLGLASLVAGRIGAVAVEALYPIITRAERQSEQFRRYAGLVIRAVAWTTTPAAILLALTASDVVTLLYGPKWSAVIPLVPLAAAAVGFAATATATNSLLLAHDEIKSCLIVDVTSAVLGVTLALWLVPVGLQVYLAALVAHGAGALGLTSWLLLRSGGIDYRYLLAALLPPAVAGAAATCSVLGLRVSLGSIEIMPLRLLAESSLFGFVYLCVLRLGFERPLRELIEVAPAGNRLGAMLAFAPRS